MILRQWPLEGLVTRKSSRTSNVTPAKGEIHRASIGKNKGAPAFSADRLPPDDARLREFIADFHAASARMRTLRQKLAEVVGLSSAEYSVLLGVWYLERRGSTTVRAIAEHLHVAGAHATAEIGKLVSRGYLSKTPDRSDGRAVGIRLTDAGIDAFRRLAPVFRDVNDKLLAGVDYSEFISVHHFFARIIDQMPAAMNTLRSAVGSRPHTRTLDQYALERQPPHRVSVRKKVGL